MRAFQRTEFFINETYEYAFSAVPPGKKKSTGKLLFIMAGITFSTSGLALGAEIGNSMVFSRALLVCLIGNLLLYPFALLWGLMGYRSGYTSVYLVKKILGDKAGIAFSILVIGTMILWVGVNGDMLAKMVIGIFSGWRLPLSVTVLLMVTIFTLCVIGGWNSLEVTAKAAVPVIVVLTVFNILQLISKKGGFFFLAQYQPENTMELIPAVVEIFGNFFLSAVTIPNLSRFAKSRRAVILCITTSAGILFVSNLCGIIIAQATEANSLSYGIYLLGMMGQSFIWMLFCTYTTQSVNIYAGSLAVQNLVRGTVMGGNISHRMAVLFIGGLSGIVGITGASGYLGKLIGVILLLALPCSVMVIAEIFMRRKRGSVDERIPLAVWCLGVAAGLVLWRAAGAEMVMLQIPVVAAAYVALRIVL